MSFDPKKVAERVRQLEANREAQQAIVDYLDEELDAKRREVSRIEQTIRDVRALAADVENTKEDRDGNRQALHE